MAQQVRKFNPWLVAIIVVIGNLLGAYVLLSDSFYMDSDPSVASDSQSR